MKKSWKSFMTVTAAAAAMTAAMAFSSLAAVAKVDDDLPENRHIVSVASGGYETGFQIKAAHGADIYETTSYPIDKKADGEDEIGTVSQGKKIEFTLNSSLPKLLARYVVTASNASPANSAREIRKVRVHSASGAGLVRVHSASGAETVRVYSASGAGRAGSVIRDNYDNEIARQFLLADEKYAIPDSVVETMVFAKSSSWVT